MDPSQGIGSSLDHGSGGPMTTHGVYRKIAAGIIGFNSHLETQQLTNFKQINLPPPFNYLF